jgi:hypothetical protein
MRTSQCRLVDLDPPVVDHAVRRHRAAAAEQHAVAGNELRGVNRDHLVIALHRRFRLETRLERFHRVTRLHRFVPADGGVCELDDKENPGVNPVQDAELDHDRDPADAEVCER